MSDVEDVDVDFDVEVDEGQADAGSSAELMSWDRYEELRRVDAREAESALARGEVDFQSSERGRAIWRVVEANRRESESGLFPGLALTDAVPSEPSGPQDFNEWMRQQQNGGSRE